MRRRTTSGGLQIRNPGTGTKGCAPLGSQTWVEGARCDDDGLGVMGESLQTVDPSPQGERDPSALPTRGCSLASMLRPLVLPPGLRVCLSQSKVAIFRSIWTLTFPTWIEFGVGTPRIGVACMKREWCPACTHHRRDQHLHSEIRSGQVLKTCGGSVHEPRASAGVSAKQTHQDFTIMTIENYHTLLAHVQDKRNSWTRAVEGHDMLT